MAVRELLQQWDEEFFHIRYPALYSSYAISLAADLLSLESFRRCMSLQRRFVSVIEKGLQISEQYADNLFQNFAMKNLRHSISEYCGSRDKTVEDMGDTIADKTIFKYLDLLFSTVCGKPKELIPTYVLAMTAPCMRFYSSLHSPVACDTGHSLNCWFDTNSLETTMLVLENTLDEFSASFSREDTKDLKVIYQQALKLAVEFFTALPSSAESIVPFGGVLDRSKVPLTLFCNFDWTCCREDSFSILEEIAITNSSKADFDQVLETWRGQARRYFEDEIRCMYSMHSGIPAPTFDYEALCNALEQYEKFERETNARVVESQLLKGLRRRDIKLAGQNSVHDGCKKIFQRIAGVESPKINVHIISSSWCGDIIRSAFSSDLNVHIHSNELVYENSVTTGEIVTKVESPMEKQKYFASVKANKTEGDQFTIYVGRRVADLLCLLEAHVGIITDPAFLRPLCTYFGIKLKPLHSSVIKSQKRISQGRPVCWKPFSGVLFYAERWEEVEAFILGL